MTADTPVPLDVRLMNLTTQLLLWLFVAITLGAGARWLMRLPFFAIEGVSVVGDVEHLSESSLRTQMTPRSQGSLFTVDLGAVRTAIEGLPWVRRAVVQREFPNRLKVTLQEHVPVAYWGDDGESSLVNSYGEVFEANLGEIEQDAMPQLDGPDGQSSSVLGMYRQLQPMFESAHMLLQALTLTERGDWQAELASGAQIELGSGEQEPVRQRLSRFLASLPQVVAQHGRDVTALQSADLRYASGYALRLQGVSTVIPAAAPPKKSVEPKAKPKASTKAHSGR